ncbi:hypothetical protein L611_001200000950 [Aminobacter sp. J15]|nr:hypothetical protein L611_001200000950 [Aminobacter sp. J15]
MPPRVIWSNSHSAAPHHNGVLLLSFVNVSKSSQRCYALWRIDRSFGVVHAISGCFLVDLLHYRMFLCVTRSSRSSPPTEEQRQGPTRPATGGRRRGVQLIRPGCGRGRRWLSRRCGRTRSRCRCLHWGRHAGHRRCDSRYRHDRWSDAHVSRLCLQRHHESDQDCGCGCCDLLGHGSIPQSVCCGFGIGGQRGPVGRLDRRPSTRPVRSTFSVPGGGGG